MLTGKQRSYLKGLAHSRKPLAQLGKEGVSEAFVAQLNTLLEQHELVKVNVLDNSSESAENAAREVIEALDAEFVQAIGNKFVIYRQSRENPMLEIPGADNRRVQVNKQNKAGTTPKEERKSKRGGTISKPLSNKKAKDKLNDKKKSEKTKSDKTTFEGRLKGRKLSHAQLSERKFVSKKINERKASKGKG